MRTFSNRRRTTFWRKKVRARIPGNNSCEPDASKASTENRAPFCVSNLLDSIEDRIHATLKEFGFSLSKAGCRSPCAGEGSARALSYQKKTHLFSAAELLRAAADSSFGLSFRGRVTAQAIDPSSDVRRPSNGCMCCLAAGFFGRRKRGDVRRNVNENALSRTLHIRNVICILYWASASASSLADALEKFREHKGYDALSGFLLARPSHTRN